MTGVLEGKVALVTGGARGIGRQTALLFAREGARIVVADLAAEGVRQTAALITEAGGAATAVVADISKSALRAAWCRAPGQSTVSRVRQTGTRRGNGVPAVVGPRALRLRRQLHRRWRLHGELSAGAIP